MLRGLIATLACCAAMGTLSAHAQAPAKSGQVSSSDQGTLASSVQTAPAGPMREALAVYAAFQNDVTALQRLEVKSATDIEAALRLVARHDPEKLAQGLYVYLAMVAAQDPGFAKEAFSVGQAFGREHAVQQLPAALSYGGALKTANEALGLSLHALEGDAQRITSVANRYHEIALKLQAQAWAKRAIGPSNGKRLASLQKAVVEHAPNGAPEAMQAQLAPAPASFKPLADPGRFGGRLFWDAAGGAEIASVVSLQAPPRLPKVSREPAFASAAKGVLTLSILYVLGGDEANPAGVSQLLAKASKETAFCIDLQRKGFFGAVSSNKLQFESVGAVREHLDSYAKCFSDLIDRQAS